VLEPIPHLRTAIWERRCVEPGASVMLFDYGLPSAEQRSILRTCFSTSRSRQSKRWQSVANLGSRILDLYAAGQGHGEWSRSSKICVVSAPSSRSVARHDVRTHGEIANAPPSALVSFEFEIFRLLQSMFAAAPRYGGLQPEHPRWRHKIALASQPLDPGRGKPHECIEESISQLIPRGPGPPPRV